MVFIERAHLRDLEYKHAGFLARKFVHERFGEVPCVCLVVM